MSEKRKLLVIDDDAQLMEAVELYLTRAGYEVSTASDGRGGLQTMYLDRPDLIVLDIMMPEMDGWEVCGRIRDVSNVPIIMLTARGQEADRVKGLKIGADDYVIKPFSLKELEARIQAVLRRAAWPPPTESPLAERRVVVQGEPLELTPTEYRLLAYLVQNAGLVLTYRQLLERVWGWEYVGDVDYVRVYIWRLRKKIERDSSAPKYIRTEHGVGYRFEKAN
jgi:two-component system KDP operon response regulator KdpE